MRSAIRKVTQNGRHLPGHLGLAYNTWAPIEVAGDEIGKVDKNEREAWLEKLASIRPPGDYETAFERRCLAYQAQHAVVQEFEADAPVLCGIGNPSAAEVGLTVDHTWGVPILPGSSIKGLLHHWLVMGYGPDGVDVDDPEVPARNAFRAAHRQRSADGRLGRFDREPGEAIQALFGAPAIDETSRGSRGGLVFHDALFVPNSVEHPFMVDILNVHQRAYYGQTSGKRPYANDHDSPNPVSFIAVRPGTRFLVAISGDEPESTSFAIEELRDALAAWGIGAKTRSGYGALVAIGASRTLEPEVEPDDEVAAVLSALATEVLPGDEQPSKQRAVLEFVEAKEQGLLAKPEPQRRLVADALTKKLGKHKKLKVRARALASRLEAGA